MARIYSKQFIKLPYDTSKWDKYKKRVQWKNNLKINYRLDDDSNVSDVQLISA